MNTGLGRGRWLTLAALALFGSAASARPLLLPPQNLAVPPLPGAPDDPEIVPLYGYVAIDEGTVLVGASRPRDAEGNYENAVHIFERDSAGRWLHAGILTDLPALDLSIDGSMAAVNTPQGGQTQSLISVFERGAAGWALTGSFQAPFGRMVRVEDGSIYMAPHDIFNPLGCMAPYQEFRRVNGTWSPVATIGGQRCDRNAADMNDGRAVITHRPWNASTTQMPTEIFASARPAWTPIGSISPPSSGQGPLYFGWGASLRGDTVHVDFGYLYRNRGGSWASAGRLPEPEAEVSIGSTQGKLRGNHLVLYGLERDYERAIEDLENNARWHVLRVYRQAASGHFVYHARLNADYHVNYWSLSDDGRQVAATGNHVNDLGRAEPRRLYVFEIPETTSFPGTRQDTFSTGNYSRWTATAGEFSVATSRGTRVLRQSNLTGESGAHLTDIDWTDQAVEADLRPLEFGGTGRWFGLVTRRSDAQNYYYVTFRSPNVVSLRRMLDGVYTELAATGTGNFQTGRNYRMRLESVGDQHAVFVDGIQVLRVKDRTLSRGHPGIAGYRTRFEVDNFVVSGGTRVLLRLDDHESGWLSDGWISATGTWEMNGQGYGSYLMQTDNEADARWYSKMVTGYQVVSARVRPQSHGTGSDPWIGLAARVVDESNYYYVTLRRSQQVSLRRMVNGQIQVLGTVPQPMTLGAWHDLRLEIVGTRIRAYVNGDLKIEVIDPALSDGGGGRNALLMWKTAADVQTYLAYQP